MRHCLHTDKKSAKILFISMHKTCIYTHKQTHTHAPTGEMEIKKERESERIEIGICAWLLTPAP